MKYLAIIALAACAATARAKEPMFHIDPSIFFEMQRQRDMQQRRDDEYYRKLEQERQLQRIEEQNERIERLLIDANDARIIDSH